MVRSLSLCGLLLSTGAACSVSFDATFDKDVSVSFGDVRTVCDNVDENGNQLPPEKRLVVIESNSPSVPSATCFWNAEAVDGVCQLEARCGFSIPMDRLRSAVGDHKDKLQDGLSLSKLSGALTHVSFLDASGNVLQPSVAFDVEHLAVSLVDGESLTDSELIDANAYAGRTVVMLAVDDLAFAVGDTLEISALASQEALDLMASELRSLPENLDAAIEVRTSFADFANADTTAFVEALRTWVVHLHGEIAGDISI